MYGDGVKYPQTVSKYWIQAGASLRILNTGLVKYPKSIRVSMRLPAVVVEEAVTAAAAATTTITTAAAATEQRARLLP